jgi:molybdopterin-guanine dinucleotide biosynthesis adapter protein
MKTTVFSVVGRSNTGKTTLIERLIPLLTARGIRVGTIKHHLHDFEMDREGKDTYRHKKAGARIAVIASPAKIGLVADLEKELSLEEMISRYMPGVDVVIVEGYKKEQMPKIEVYNYKEDQPPVSTGDPDVLAIVSDRPMEATVPVFSRDEVEKIAEFLVENLGLKGERGREVER